MNCFFAELLINNTREIKMRKFLKFDGLKAFSAFCVLLIVGLSLKAIYKEPESTALSILVIIFFFSNFNLIYKKEKINLKELRKIGLSVLIIMAIINIIGIFTVSKDSLPILDGLISVYWKETAEKIMQDLFLMIMSFVVCASFVEEVAKNTLPEKTQELSTTEMPTFMRVGERYYVLGTFHDWTGATINVLCENGHSTRSSYFCIKTSATFSPLPNRSFKIMEIINPENGKISYELEEC